MVNNHGISPIAASQFKADNASANKMSEEKYGQGGEYFMQEAEEEQALQQQTFQDRSAQLRASLNGLAMANYGSIMLMKTLKEKEEQEKKKKKFLPQDYEESEQTYEESPED